MVPDPARGPALPDAAVLVDLFDELSGVMFCLKGVDGRYTEVNDAFVRRTRETRRDAVVGRRARELFVAELAERYEEQDAEVLATGRPLRHELELIRGEGGEPGWYLTTKLPVRDGAGAVTGVAIVSEDLRSADESDPAMVSLARVAELVHARLAEPLRLADLAEAAGCSTSSLERRVRRVHGLSPTQFVLRARIDAARALLTGTDRPIADIATATGFYDQPAFTRQFARLAGETPGQHRRRARERT
ncbi:AraC family transcriptional regulator [Rhodococcus aerolatus]